MKTEQRFTFNEILEACYPTLGRGNDWADIVKRLRATPDSSQLVPPITEKEGKKDISLIKTKTKEEILIYCFGKECYESETADIEDSGFIDSTKEAMDLWSEQNCEIIRALFNNPCIELNPLEDLWRKENSPNKFVIPDRTSFYRWITNKVLSAPLSANAITDEKIGGDYVSKEARKYCHKNFPATRKTTGLHIRTIAMYSFDAGRLSLSSPPKELEKEAVELNYGDKVECSTDKDYSEFWKGTYIAKHPTTNAHIVLTRARPELRIQEELNDFSFCRKTINKP